MNKTQRNGKIVHAHVTKINIVKISTLPKATYGFSEIPIKIPMTFLIEIEQKNPTICIELQKTLDSQSNLEKNDQSGGITLPDFKLYYKTIIIKTAWYWQKNRHKLMEHN